MKTHPQSARSISVIVTNYNYGKLLEETFNSLKAQDRPIDQIIIVDDASSDNSPELITRLASENVNVTPVLLESNVGNFSYTVCIISQRHYKST